LSSDLFDIFISYASQDRGWVREFLYTPLTQCVFASSGQAPRIFLDKSDLGLGPGLFPKQLTDAVLDSRRLIAVISRNYFDKSKAGWTERELWQAITQDPVGRQGKVVPLFIDDDESAREEVVRSLIGIQAYDVADPDPWFGRLSHALGLRPTARERKLRFVANPTQVVVNNTLAPVTVAVSDGVDAERDQIFVELSASIEGLEGTLRRSVKGGVAIFDDLSFKGPGHEVRLTAKLAGHAPATSEPFSIKELTTTLPQEPVAALLRHGGKPGDTQVFFFENGRALCLSDRGRTMILDRRGVELGRAAAMGDLRLVRTAGRSMLLADWQGGLLVTRDDGGRITTSLARNEPDRSGGSPFVVPGDCALVDDGVLVGLWNGDVHRVEEDGSHTRVLHHEHGVQALEVSGRNVLLCDFHGSFVVYEGSHLLYSKEIESQVISMRRLGRGVVIVTDARPYQFSFSGGHLIPCDWLRLSAISETLSIGERILLLDQRGKGVVLDEELHERRQFHVRAGARPWCAAVLDGDEYVSFQYPEGNYALMRNGQVVYTNTAGLLAFDPALETVALGTPEGVRLRGGRDFLADLSRSS
jgi:hypothetical protein